MKIFEDLFLLQQLDYLIRTKATGCPEQLAGRLGLSRRNSLRLIAQLRNEGFPISYDKNKGCYYYTCEVKINFELIVDNTYLLKIKGGKNIFENNHRVPDFGNEPLQLCSTD